MWKTAIRMDMVVAMWSVVQQICSNLHAYVIGITVVVMICVSYESSSSVLRQEIGWEECLRNDLFCVG